MVALAYALVYLILPVLIVGGVIEFIDNRKS